MNTPVNSGLLQSDIDFAGFKPLNADLSDYALGGDGGSGLDENTVTAEDIGLIGDGVTDNTAALQAWLDSVEAAKVSSTLLVPDGVYVFSGPLQDGSRRNAQILLPTVASTDSPYSVTIKGYHLINFAPWPEGYGHFPVPQGPIFKSTLAVGSGTRPAFIGGRGPIGGVGPENNYLLLHLENMILQTVQNPQISCLNFDHMSQTELAGDILIVAGNGVAGDDMVQPTTTTSYGLIYPGFSYSVVHTCDNVNVFNFYNGALVGENCTLSIIGAWGCYYGFEAGFAYGVILVGTMTTWHCKYGLNITGVIQMRINLFNTEHNTSGWTTLVYDVVDATNQAIGDITWWQNTAFVGPGTNFLMNGGANLNTRQVGSRSPIYVGTDARFTAVSGGVKLEARNTGTGVWVEAARWTNP